jgi:hypothetical protein
MNYLPLVGAGSTSVPAASVASRVGGGISSAFGPPPEKPARVARSFFGLPTRGRLFQLPVASARRQRGGPQQQRGREQDEIAGPSALLQNRSLPCERSATILQAARLHRGDDMRWALIGAVLSALIGACTWLYLSQRAIYAHPEKVAGQQVWLCGYIQDKFESREIWLTQLDYKNNGLGLGFISDQVAPNNAEGPLHQRTTCIRATIIRTGCAKELICFWSHFEYAARLVKPN